jgi:hypothetical protein
MTRHRFYGLRGEAYGLEKERIYDVEKESIASYFWDIYDRSGKFTPKDLGACAMHYKIPLTIMSEFLHKATNGKFPSTTWDLLKERGCKAKDIGVVWD